MKITTSGYLIKNWLEGWKVLEVIKAWLVSENRGGLTNLRMYQSHPWFVHDGVLAENILIGEGVANQPDKTKYWGKFWVSTYLDSWPWVHTLRDKLGWAMGGGSPWERGWVHSPKLSFLQKKQHHLFSCLVMTDKKRMLSQVHHMGGGWKQEGRIKFRLILAKL